jgi:hypothetical protein
VAVVPDVLEDRRPGERLATVLHEEAQERELLGREVHLLPAALDDVASRVDDERTAPKGSRALRRPPTEEGPEPAEELGEGERLDQVVVRPSVEPGDPVGDGVASGQHEDRDRDAPPPELLAHGEAVEDGEHDVEDDGVVGPGPGLPQALAAVRGGGDGEAGVLEALTEQVAHLGVVLDHQDLHGARVPRPARGSAGGLIVLSSACGRLPSMAVRRRRGESVAPGGVHRRVGSGEDADRVAKGPPGLRDSFVRGYAEGYYGTGASADGGHRELDLPRAAAYRRGRVAGRATRQRVRTPSVR